MTVTTRVWIFGLVPNSTGLAHFKGTNWAGYRRGDHPFQSFTRGGQLLVATDAVRVWPIRLDAGLRWMKSLGLTFFLQATKKINHQKSGLGLKCLFYLNSFLLLFIMQVAARNTLMWKSSHVGCSVRDNKHPRSFVASWQIT